MTIQQAGDGVGWTIRPEEFVTAAAEKGVSIMGLNCCAPWDAEEFLSQARKLQPVIDEKVSLSVMPNAGGFQRIGNRYMTRVNPEFMGRMARTLAQSGVRLIGGCCEVHPEHVREMHNYIRGFQAEARSSVNARQIQEQVSIGDEEKRRNGRFSRKLKDEEFAVSVEILPSRGTDEAVLERKIQFVRELSESGFADALDVTDGSRGIPLIPPGDFISIIREKLSWSPENGDQLEFIPHFTCRDLNIMGLQSRLVGLHLRRIHNVLFITGDPPKMSPTYPRSTAVFDANSMAMIGYTHSFLNAGLDFGGQLLGRSGEVRTRFTIGTGFEPEALDRAREIDKLNQKIEAGADYVFTQPVFRYEALDQLEPFRQQIPILAGVMILANLDHAVRVGQVPGVVIPAGFLDRLARFEDTGDQAKLGREIAIEQVEWVKSQGWSGLYLMSPASHRPVVEVLRDGLH
jgi:homocysteine S-methyltransferase